MKNKGSFTKEIKKDDFIMTHDRVINDFGFEQDNFSLFNVKDRVHMPFFGHIKLSDSFIPGKIGYTYSEDDYNEMINEQITKYEIYKRKR